MYCAVTVFQIVLNTYLHFFLNLLEKSNAEIYIGLKNQHTVGDITWDIYIMKHLQNGIFFRY